MRVPALVVFGLLALVPAARAAWSTDPTVNTLVSLGPGNSGMPMILSDGEGGVLIFWNGAGLRRAHLTSTGDSDPFWPSLAPMTDTGASLVSVLVSDGNSGAIVIWRSNHDLVAQRVLSDGSIDPTWPGSGLTITSESYETYLTATADGAGGAYVAWSTAPVNWSDLYAHHILGDGTLDGGWPAGGLAVRTTGYDKLVYEIASDGEGGAMVLWADGFPYSTDPYLQRVREHGAVEPSWPAEGVAIFPQLNIQQPSIDMTLDGAGGVIVARAMGDSLLAQRVLITGVRDPAWPPGGLKVYLGAGDVQRPRVVPDGAGGALIVWRARDSMVRAHRVLSSGTLAGGWPANGAILASAPGYGDPIDAIPDGAGGALVAWPDSRAGNRDIYAGRILSSGIVDPNWPVHGAPVCTAPGIQWKIQMVPDGRGGAILTWEDSRTSQLRVFAQRIGSDGQLGPPPVGSVGARDANLWLGVPRPNPGMVAMGTSIDFGLAREGRAQVFLLDVAGREVRRLLDARVPAGRQRVEWDGRDAAGRPVAGGLYFVRLTAAGQSRIGRIALLP